MTDPSTPLTPTSVRDLLRRHGLAPRKSDGQNFLVDPNTVERLLDAADLGPDDHVLEVGPGLGSMTVLLQDRVARVTAVEIDAGLARVVDDLTGPTVTVVHDDVLQLDLAALVDGPVRLLSNLPYNAATPILLRLLDSGFVVDAWTMTQLEVGERWTATAGDAAYGAVSVKVALAGVADLGLRVPRTVFHPTPRVDSVMVRVAVHDDVDPTWRRRVGHVAEIGFRQRRKTLRNNLRAGLGDDAVTAAADAGFDLGRRAETLDVDEWRSLTAALVDGDVEVPPTPW